MTVRARILVVEDAPPVLDLFREALDRAGFEVDSTSTASEAMEVLATRRYAVILADCLLGDLPVLDWLAALRGVAPQTPLILQSGHIGEEELRGYAAEFRAAAVAREAVQRGAAPGRPCGRQRGVESLLAAY